ncbi:MAG: chemotaxis protein CheB [Candidatus Accumulibacter meliphilus]|uniref:chemotaxis protein CheB n=1 Tax=Candidatus Accumulibacter meliphilus TaxID=2211374 RepID=UPI002FC2F7E0
MQGGKTTGKTTPQASVTPPSDSDLPASTPDTPFPIVGIGASAGGLAAFEAFFSGMPADHDPGMAFVLVRHWRRARRHRQRRHAGRPGDQGRRRHGYGPGARLHHF